MRLKTNRRLILLAVSVAVLAVAAFALYFVRNWQKDRMTDEFFAKGQDAFKARQYYAALTDTAQFLTRVKSNPVKRAEPRYADALLVYAESRRLIEENDDHNIRDAIPWYQQYRDLRPDDAKTRFTLLQSLNQVGLFVEARDLALKYLPKDLAQAKVEDAPTLREYALALRRLAKNDLSDPHLSQAIDRLLALTPLDVQANLMRLEFEANSGRKTEARALADRLLKEHPDDPSALVIAAYSREIPLRGNEMTASDQSERHDFLCKAAGLDPKTAARLKPAAYADELYVLQLVSAFDASRAFEFSHAVLQDAADKVSSTVIERLLVRRLWQENENEKILARTAALSPESPDAHSELLGFRALALQRTGKAEAAAAIAAGLSKREGDFRAGGWSAAIPLIEAATRPKPDEQPKAAEAASAWKLIVSPKGNPNEPVFLAYYGVALSAAGRQEEARRAWQDAQAVPAGASWFLPALRIAESYLAEGRADEAAVAADAAMQIAGNRAAVIVTWFEAQAARIQKGSTAGPNPADLLTRLEESTIELTKAVSGDDGRILMDRLLIPRVLLLARSNRADDAHKAGLEAIQREPAPAPEILQRLAAISASEHLGFEEQAMRRVEAISGPTISVLFVKATELANAGKADEGLALLRNAAQQKPGDVALQLAIARYLERTANREATAAWVKIGDANPSDLNIQKACLQSTSAAGDAAFIERSCQRYATLLGSEPGPGDVIAYTARARAAMWGTPSKADRDKAIGLLDGVVRAQPALAEPKLLLAAALAYTDPSRDIKPDLPRAIAQLTDASAIEPRNAGLSLDLARLLQRQREFGRSRDILTRMATDAASDDSSRRAAAELLISQGEPGPVASDTLAAIAERLGNKTPASLLVVLAEAYLAQRQEAKAAALYERLAGGAANDADSVYATARYFALRSDTARAASVIATLDSLKLEPGIKDYALARIAADSADPAGAKAHYESAVAAAPTRADIWRQYAQFLMRAGQYADAAKVADRAVKAAPQDPTLAGLVEQTRMVSAGDTAVDPKAILRALAADPSQPDAAEALRAWEAAAAKGETGTADGLASLADKFPSFVPLQLIVARGLAPIAPDRAVIIARRAMSTSPTDPAPAKAAAEIYLVMERWQDMLAAALEWQKRDTSRSTEADIAVAQAYLKLKQFDKGLQVLTPLVSGATSRPTEGSSLGVLNIQSRLLVGSGKEAEARALLSPLLPSSPTVRISIWLATAAEDAPTLEIAQMWMDQLLPAIPADSVEERLALVSAFPLLAGRFPKSAPDLLKQAITMLEQMTQNPKLATAATWESLGVVLHGKNDLAGAEAAYRKAIELDAKRAISLNNLAGIVLESQGKVEEALALAQRAVESTPKPVSNNLDTLASVHAAIARRSQDKGDAPGAARSFKTAADLYRRAAELDPGNLGPLSSAVNMYEKAGDPDNAAACYEIMLGYQSLTPDQRATARNNLAMSLLRLNKSKADLDRAVSLAVEATRFSDQPAFWDTLGWCQLAADRAQEAASSFRQAMEKAAARKQRLPSAAIGLATILGQGPVDQKVEAAKLLDAVEAQQREPGAQPLDAEDTARYQRARDAIKAAH